MIGHTELAKRFGTPAYIYDLDRIAMAKRDLFAALPDEVDLFYAVKANPHPEVCAGDARRSGTPLPGGDQLGGRAGRGARGRLPRCPGALHRAGQDRRGIGGGAGQRGAAVLRRVAVRPAAHRGGGRGARRCGGLPAAGEQRQRECGDEHPDDRRFPLSSDSTARRCHPSPAS